jgi:serine/threonine protein kinase
MDNLMLVSDAEDSNITIIDFGHMVRLEDNETIYISDQLQGTEGTLFLFGVILILCYVYIKYICAYIHINIHLLLHILIYAYIHTYIHTYIHILIYSYTHVSRAGMYAPESVTSFSYSYKSDVWQAGCILYCMLSGRPAFHWSDEYRYLIPEGRYASMTGKEWDGISDQARDLVQQCLSLDPEARPTPEQILRHDWFRSVRGDTGLSAPLGAGYTQRIKLLEMRKSMANLFKQHVDIPIVHKEKKLRIARISSTMSDQSQSAEDTASITFLADKLKRLKAHLLTFISCKATGLASPSVTASACAAAAAAAAATAAASRVRPRASSTSSEYRHRASSTSSEIDPLTQTNMLEFFCDEMDVGKYCETMRSLDLDSLATPEYFTIFDAYPCNGIITMKELLFTLISFRAPQDGDAATLFFNLFCLKENSYIDLEELQAVTTCLLTDVSSAAAGQDLTLTAEVLQALFDEIDSEPRDGRIGLEEFRVFYDLCMRSNMSTSNVLFTTSSSAASGRDRAASAVSR